MFKKTLRPIYIPLLSYLRKIIYFYLPNIFNLNRIQKKDTPEFQQRTIVTGKGIVQIGENCSFGFKPGGFWRGGCIEIQPRHENAKIIIGNKLSTNNNIFICAMNSVIIGDNSLIGQNVTIMDFEAHGINPSKRNTTGEIGEVIIGENVWLGNNVIILKNSNIGKNTIVAAGAVVSGVFPENVIIGGIPAKIIKKIDVQ